MQIIWFNFKYSPKQGFSLCESATFTFLTSSITLPQKKNLHIHYPIPIKSVPDDDLIIVA